MRGLKKSVCVTLSLKSRHASSPGMAVRLAIKRFVGDGNGELALPFGERRLRQLSEGMIKGVFGSGDKHLEEPAGPGQQMPGEKLRKRLLLRGFAQPGGQQQERTKMIFRLLALRCVA